MVLMRKKTLSLLELEQKSHLEDIKKRVFQLHNKCFIAKLWMKSYPWKSQEDKDGVFLWEMSPLVVKVSYQELVTLNLMPDLEW